MQTPLPMDLQELHAYADGQLGPEARARVEDRLAADAEARRQVDDYLDLNRLLRERYDAVLTESVPERLRSPKKRVWRPVAAAAAGMFLFTTGFASGLWLQNHGFDVMGEGDHVVREAAAAYAVYTPEVRHPVEVAADQEQHLVTWLTNRMGARIHAPVLTDQGFSLMGGRLLAFDDGPGALFMYEDAGGHRIVLTICLNEEEGKRTAFRFAEHEKVSVFYWFDGPFSYALAGEMKRTDLLNLAESVYRQIVS